jgi:hypothetical protein
VAIVAIQMAGVGRMRLMRPHVKFDQTQSSRLFRPRYGSPAGRRFRQVLDSSGFFRLSQSGGAE